ncbi:MAG: type 1 glutamine amidotransferase [Nitrospirota bacterium]
MNVLILKNVPHEGPGTIEDFLKREGVHYRIVELGSEKIPDDDYDALVMMGGPMSVNDGEIYHYLKEEERVVREYIRKDKKILGICLGAQMLARALGSKVYKGPGQEIGWYPIELTGEAMRDPLMLKLAYHPRSGDLWKKFMVFHWHGETFDIPEGAVKLASSELYSNQAFRYGGGAYAFQFHIEVRKEMILEWLKDEAALPKISKETETFYEEYLGRAENFYKGFFSS